MVFTQEILLTNEHTSEQDWQRFFNVIGTRAKGLKPIELEIIFDGSIVRFFSISKKDLTHISNGLDGFLFQSLNSDDMEMLKTALAVRKRIFVRIPKFGTIFDLKEKYLVKKGIDLKVASFKIRRIFTKLFWKREFIFDVHGIKKTSKKLSNVLVPKILDIDFYTNSSYIKRRISNYLDIEKTAPFLNTRNENPLLSVNMFPYSTREHFLNLTDYEFDKHSFIVGASGSGKSRFIELLVDRLGQTHLKNNYRVIVIDPHDALRENLMHIPSTLILNFSKEGTSLFPDSQADITASTELTSTLLLSLMGSTSNSRLERLLRFTTYVLFVAQAMSMTNLKRFLTDLEARTQILNHVKGYIPDNIEHFFGSEFNEIKTQHYVEAFQPIVALIDEMELQPTLSADGDVSMLNIIEENFLTVFSLNKVSMGEKVVKTVAGLLIQQIFLLAQARAFNQKVILVVDEVSVVQNPTLAAILAESRKFGMSVILTQQYFGQVESSLQQAILSNAINYYVFKVSEEDARILEGNVSMEIPKSIVEAEMIKGLTEADIRVKMMTELNPRECIVRVAAAGRVLPAIKAKTMTVDSATKYSNGNNIIELEEQNRQVLPDKFIYAKKEGQYKSIVDEKAQIPKDIVEILPQPLPHGENLVSVNSTISNLSESHEPDELLTIQEPSELRSNSNLPPNILQHRSVRESLGSSPEKPLNMAQVLATQSSSRIPIKEKLVEIDKEIKKNDTKIKVPLKPYIFEQDNDQEN